MGIVQNFLERRRRQKEKIEEYEDNDKILSNIERKKLTHNEREIIAILKRDKEEHLKEALKFENERRKAEELHRTRSFMLDNPFHLME